MTCRECSEFLSDYLEGALPDSVRGTFEGHLAHCPNCVTYLEQLRTAIRAGQLALIDTCDAETEPPEELIRAILEARKSQR